MSERLVRIARSSACSGVSSLRGSGPLVQRLSRRVLGVMAGLPPPVSAFITLLGSALVAYSSGCGQAAPYMGHALAAAAPAHTLPAGAHEPREASTESLEADALLARFAPSFAQEISPGAPERDRPLAIDFDADWDATNNWAHLTPELSEATATVYGSAILTPTHAFLTYTLFYPRDWFSPVCVPYICHDNDLEVALLVVTRPRGADAGEILFLETKAHHDYVTARGSELLLDEDGRPWLSVESQGHGMHPIRVGDPLSAGALRLVPAGEGRVGRERGERTERYDLASLHETLWARRAPSAANGALWISGEDGFLTYSGARQGRRGGSLGISMAGKEYAGGVRPPWGLKAPAGERGDWFLDPAYVAAVRHETWLPATLSLDYVFNPFLDDLAAECLGQGCPATPRPPSLRSAGGGLAGGALLGMGLWSLNIRRRAARGSPRSWRRWRAP